MGDAVHGWRGDEAEAGRAGHDGAARPGAAAAMGTRRFMARSVAEQGGRSSQWRRGARERGEGLGVRAARRACVRKEKEMGWEDRHGKTEGRGGFVQKRGPTAEGGGVQNSREP
jgi:hypothetical protein